MQAAEDVLPPERPASLARRAADEIRAMIADGRLRPGARVNELGIARSLGISRGPVREAVGRLASSGLLVEEPNVGPRVVAPDAEAIRELFLVRELLEGQAAMEAAAAMGEDELQGLHAVLDRHAARLEGRAAAATLCGDDEDFHALILKGSRNRLIDWICGNSLRDLLLLVRTRNEMRATRGRQALEEHRQIAEAIATRNGEVAALLMRQHIRISRDLYLRIVAEGAATDTAPLAQP